MIIRFRYSLSRLFIVFTLVSIGIVLISLRIREADSQRTAIKVIDQFGGLTFFDYQIDDTGSIDAYATTPLPAWLNNFLDVNHIADVVRVDLSAHWHPEWSLRVGGKLDPTNPSNAVRVAKAICNLSGLEVLRLTGAQFTDAWMDHLEGMTRLQELYLIGTGISAERTAMLQKVLPNCKVHRVHKQ